MRKVYLLYTCDAWKSQASMLLRGVFDQSKHVVSAVKTLVKNGVIERTKVISYEDIENVTDVHVVETYVGAFEDTGGWIR